MAGPPEIPCPWEESADSRVIPHATGFAGTRVRLRNKGIETKIGAS